MVLSQVLMNKELFLWVLGLALVVAVAVGYAHQRNLQQRYHDLQQGQENLAEIRAKVESLKDQVEKTRGQVKKMESDPLEIEAVLRLDRKLTRDDEIIFHVEGPPSGDAVQGETADSPRPEN